MLEPPAVPLALATVVLLATPAGDGRDAGVCGWWESEAALPLYT